MEIEDYENNLLFESWHNKNALLPGWFLVKCSSKIQNLSNIFGLALSKKENTAQQKAISEYAERELYFNWSLTNISPFSKKKEECPRDSTGFAAHTDKSIAVKNALFEWLERLTLQNIYENRLAIERISVPNIFPLSKLFYKIYRINICCYRAKIDFNKKKYYFVFSTINFAKNAQLGKKFPGFLFSSAVGENLLTLQKKTIEDALRPFPILNTSLDQSIYTRNYGFWLSENGEIKMRQFLENANSRSSWFEIKLPINSEEYCLKFKNRWIAYYKNPDYQTARILTHEIPLT